MHRKAASAIATMAALSLSTGAATAMANSAQAASRDVGQGQAGESRGEANQFHATIKNLTSRSLKPKSSIGDTNLTWGKWGQLPAEVSAGSTSEAFWSQGRANSPSGTTGYVTYQLGDNPNTWFRIDFDSPYIGSNSCSVQTSGDDLIVQADGYPSGGSSQDASFKVAHVG